MPARNVFISFFLISVSIILFLVISGIKSIKVDAFEPAAVMFLIEDSAYNQQNLAEQKKFVKHFCSILDPEDKIKIFKVAKDSFIIYEGSPQNGNAITKSLNSFIENSNTAEETSYGEAVKKAVNYCLSMKNDGYVPVIIVIGSLENYGQLSKQMNWNTLPSNIYKTKKFLPDLTMAFLWAHPSKLDFVKGKLNPVLGEEHLIIATEETVDKVSGKIFKAMGR